MIEVQLEGCIYELKFGYIDVRRRCLKKKGGNQNGKT